jgi:hypothetical protein
MTGNYNMPGKRITLEQEEEAVRLYRSHKYSIKDILAKTGIKSEQTLYRIMYEREIPMMRRNGTGKVSLLVDNEVAAIIEEAKPHNLSEFLCELIKIGYWNRGGG